MNRRAPAIPLSLMLLCMTASVHAVGPGPHDVAIPSTGQRLSIVITQPADGGTIPLTPGTGDLRGQCAIGAVPPGTFNVLYVVDVSGSTDRAYMQQFGIPLVDVNGDGVAGGPGDDVNGDGQAGDTLDGELAGVLALNASLGTAAANVGVVAFASHAAAADVDPADGVQTFTALGADGDGDGTPDVETVLRSLDSSFDAPSGGQIGKFTLVPRDRLGFQTNFAEALQAANAALAGFPPADRNLVFFLSDGRSSAGSRCVDGDCAAALAAAAAAHTTVNTYGVGTEIDAQDLQFIATRTGGTFVAVVEPARLSTVLPMAAPAGLDHAEVDGESVPLDALGRFGSTITCRDRAPFTVTARCIATDAAHTSVTADVTLTCTGECGDGVLDPGEDCDDGNTRAGDCCSPGCVFEPTGSRCGVDDGDACNGDTVCHAGVCGAATPADALACGTASEAAVVTNFDDDTMSVVDATSEVVSDPVHVDDKPWGVALHPRGREMYVTDRGADHLSVVDAVTHLVVATIAVDNQPLGVAVAPDGARVYVASYGTDRLDVIDTATRKVVAKVPVGRGPSGMAFDATGRALYVANYADDTVSVVDTVADAVVATTRVGHLPVQIVVDPLRGRVYVTDYGNGMVSVLGTVSRTVLRTVHVGRGPFGVAVDAGRGRAFVTNASGDSVSVLDAAAETVVATVPVGRVPLGVAVDLAGRAWIASSGAAAIEVLDPQTATIGATLGVGKVPVAFGSFIGALGTDCPRAAPTCDDADPTTVDACTSGGGCGHTPLATLDAVRALLAALDTGLRAAPPGALGSPKSARALTDAVSGASSELTPDGPRARFGRARKQLGRFAGVVTAGFRTRTIDRDIGLRLLDLARGARARLRGAR